MRKNLLIVVCAAMAATNVYSQKPRLDPGHVMGAEACSECHGKEVDAWRRTTHFATFKTLEDNPKANDIADAMGVDDLTSDSLCIECHFTMQEKNGRTKAISGISCESCHGAASEWIKEHNKETASREQRKSVSVGKGMLYPDNLYGVASNCFDCHIVDKEDLVNKGGHPAFSKDFDLAGWSQGEVRHSFMVPGTPVKKDGGKNEAASPERRRMLYMVGKILALEYSVRAIGKATENKGYAGSHVKHYFALMKQLDALNQLAATDEVTEIVRIAKGLPSKDASKNQIKTKNDKGLAAAADKISALARKFATTHDGSNLGAIDSKIPAAKGKVYQP